MAITVKGFDGNPFDQRSIVGITRMIQCLHLLSFSGNYSTGGDTLDWTNGGVNSAVPPDASGSTTGPVRTDVDDATGAITTVTGKNGQYVIILGTTLSNWKCKIYVTPGVEYSAGAYGTDVTQDTVILSTYWVR